MIHAGIIDLQCCERQTQVFIQGNVKFKNIKARLLIVFDLGYSINIMVRTIGYQNSSVIYNAVTLRNKQPRQNTRRINFGLSATKWLIQLFCPTIP